MALAIKRVLVNTSEEEQLLTGLIVDDEFCRRVLAMLRPELMQDRYSQRIAQWVRQYHVEYGRAPGVEIQSYFNAERANLNDAESSVIEAFLSNLSKRYAEKESHNWEYQVDLARNFLRKRSLTLLADQIKLLKDRGDLDKAERLVAEYNITQAQTSRWVFPLVDEELQQRIINRVDAGPFKLDGALGEIFGYWQKGWLVAYFGGYKRGKTWWLAETAIQALLQGLRVVYISLEMFEEDMGKRFLQMATTLPDKAGSIVIPVWDCKSNQEDSCNLSVRTNQEPLTLGHDGLPKYNPSGAYQPCIYCKQHHEYLENYRIASWFATVEKDEDFKSKVIERTKSFAMQYNGGNLAFLSYPRFSADLEQVDTDIQDLIATWNFAPDMIVLDYADILAEGGGNNGDEWLRLDHIWKKLARMAGERKAIVVSASQITDKGLDAKSVKQNQVAGFRGKLGHIDLGISLNQIGDAEGKLSERQAMLMRLGTLAKRHGHQANEEVFVLQALDIGQPMLDAYAVSAGHKLLSQEWNED